MTALMHSKLSYATLWLYKSTLHFAHSRGCRSHSLNDEEPRAGDCTFKVQPGPQPAGLLTRTATQVVEAHAGLERYPQALTALTVMHAARQDAAEGDPAAGEAHRHEHP